MNIFLVVGDTLTFSLNLTFIAEWSSGLTHQAHNLGTVGSNPTSATIFIFNQIIIEHYDRPWKQRGNDVCSNLLGRGIPCLDWVVEGDNPEMRDDKVSSKEYMVVHYMSL